MLAYLLFTPSPSYSEGESDHDGHVALELSALGRRGDQIARARGQVLAILQSENTCSAWFQEIEPDSTEIFRSLHFDVEKRGPSQIYSSRDADRGLLLKHPWAAKSFENSGRNSVVQINANGPFFSRVSRIMQLYPGETLARPAGNAVLVVSSYGGNSREAQIVILLHELGHVTGRLPEDDDSWDGRSSRNTSEVLRHCKVETRAAARNSSTSTN